MFQNALVYLLFKNTMTTSIPPFQTQYSFSEKTKAFTETLQNAYE